jgi:hypothetical protein
LLTFACVFVVILQVTAVLSCLEERLKTEIFHRLRQQSGSATIDIPQDIADVDLNKHYVCDVESRSGQNFIEKFLMVILIEVRRFHVTSA